jgi:hypothetical protein
MELTYDVMMDFTKKYFDLLKTIRPKEDPAIVNKISNYFASDFQIRWDEPPVLWDRKQWVDHLCGHSEEYIAHVIYEPYPLMLWIDDRKKVVGTYIREEARHPKTNSLLKVFLIIAYFELKLENGEPKFWREFITFTPGMYSSDVIPKGEK